MNDKNRKDINFTLWSIISFMIAFFTISSGATGILFFCVGLACIVFKVKINKYFKLESFIDIKKSIQKNVNDVNELNQHINNLKKTYPTIAKNTGNSYLQSGGLNFKRKGWELLDQKEDYVHNCSLQIVKNSKTQPFKYICKYFDIKPEESTLNDYENALNNFLAVEQGKKSLLRERDKIFNTITEKIPKYVKKFAPIRLMNELGFDEVNFSENHFPQYSFQYVSAGGNSIAKNIITMDTRNLENFIEYLNSQIKWKKSIAGQRALMTASLREEIKKRDNYTCKQCKASVKKEPNLLLEIDHIIPLSKGGITAKDNLQTLCWRCNRSKGSKLQ